MENENPSEAEQVCYETYAALGMILMEMAEGGHPQAEKLMDNLSQARLVHQDVLPFADALPIEAEMKADVGPEDFGVPAEFAERARNFANFIAAAERERCARIVDDYGNKLLDTTFCEVSAAIRRG